MALPPARESREAVARRLRIEDLSNDDAKWVKLKKITYRDPRGRERAWEMATRPVSRPSVGPGRRADADTDAEQTATADYEGCETTGIDIIAVLHHPGAARDPEIVLQKQYRPPTDRVMIEVPAGLMDADETPEQCALRELHEETGYRGTIISKGPDGFNDAGLSDASMNYVNVSIDMSRPENKQPQPQLDDGEFIETFTVPLRDLYAELCKLETLGYGVSARVDAIAEGVELAKRFHLAG
ncbi:hypothetical protein KEM52_006566 [Ascosphaera acerosa]|nr:hypothetical protein KEM52_006566 [Ascosphaera acerosa]